MSIQRVEDPYEKGLLHQVEISDDATPEQASEEINQFLQFLEPQQLQYEATKNQLDPASQKALDGVSPELSGEPTTNEGSGQDILGRVTPIVFNDDDVLSQAIKNTPASAVNFVTDMGNAALGLINPMNPTTWQAIGGLMYEAGELAVGGEYDKSTYIKGLGDNLKERYGTLENLKETIATDPVGFASDAIGILTLGTGTASTGLKIAGKVGKASRLSASTLNKLQKTDGFVRGLGKVADKLDPATWVTGAGKKLLTGTAKGGAMLAESMLGKGLHFTKSRVRRIQGFSGGLTPARWMLNKEVWGGPDAMKGRLDEIIETASLGVDKAIDRIVEKDYSRLVSRQDLPAAGYLLDDMINDRKGLNSNLSKSDTSSMYALQIKLDSGNANLKDIQQIKRLAAKHESSVSKAFEDKSPGARNKAQVEDVGNLYVEVKDFIEGEANAHGEFDIGKLNNDTQVANAVKDALFDSTMEGATHRAFGLRDLLLLGYGEPVLGASLMFGKKVLDVPAVRSKLVKTLDSFTDSDISELQDVMRTGIPTMRSEKLGVKIKSVLAPEAMKAMMKLNVRQQQRTAEDKQARKTLPAWMTPIGI